MANIGNKWAVIKIRSVLSCLIILSEHVMCVISFHYQSNANTCLISKTAILISVHAYKQWTNEDVLIVWIY